MAHSVGWVKLPKLVDEGECTAAAEDSLKSGLKSTPKCQEVMRKALMVRVISCQKSEYADGYLE
jgi:hypothetical protein